MLKFVSCPSTGGFAADNADVGQSVGFQLLTGQRDMCFSQVVVVDLCR